MASRELDDTQIAALLQSARSIAVVGLSPDPTRPSHGVARYLQGAGYRIIPVNPKCERVLGERCYPRLIDIAEPVDIVDCFRRSEEMPAIARDAVAIAAKLVWMQFGVISEEAARIAHDAGLAVVMDRCLKIDHARLCATTN